MRTAPQLLSIFHVRKKDGDKKTHSFFLPNEHRDEGDHSREFGDPLE